MSSQIALRVPESLAQQIRRLAKQDGCSINSFITLAVAEKVAVMQAEERSAIQEMAAKADVKAAQAVLKKIKD